MAKIKTIIELEKEKEEMIIKYDELIRQATLRRVQQNEEDAKIRRAAIKELEDEGWNSSYINPHQPFIVDEPIVEVVYDGSVKIETAVPLPEPTETDPKEAQLIKLREQIAALEAVAELEKEEPW